MAGAAAGAGLPLFTAGLFKEAVKAREAYAREHPDCHLALRLVGGDDIYVGAVQATTDEGLVCACVERGREPGAQPVAIVPWAAVLRVDVIERLPWAGTPGFRPG